MQYGLKIAAIALLLALPRCGESQTDGKDGSVKFGQPDDTLEGDERATQPGDVYGDAEVGSLDVKSLNEVSGPPDNSLPQPDVQDPAGCGSNVDCTEPNLPYCVVETGDCVECLHESHCADGDTCNEDLCQDGVCSHGPGGLEDCCNEDGDCVDEDECTLESCQDNLCLFEQVDDCCNDDSECDDDNVCTNQECYDHQCHVSPIPDCCLDDAECNDDNLCTIDFCQAHACNNEPMPDCCDTDEDCNDNNPCTADACVGTACQLIPLPDCCVEDDDCDDSDVCTTDHCFGNGCVATPVPGCCKTNGDCDDGDMCTKEVCGPGNQCSYKAMGCCNSNDECDDGNPCTVDLCKAGMCEHNGGECLILNAVQDVWLETDNANKAGFDFLIVGKTGEFVKKRTLIQFEDPVLPPGKVVQSATLEVYYFVSTKPGWNPAEQGIDRTIQVHRMLVPWAENQATAKNASFNKPWSVKHVGTNDVDAESQALDAKLWEVEVYEWKSLDVSAAVKAWVANPNKNHGLLLWADNENQAGMDMRFYSREHNGDEGLRPRIKVIIGKDEAIPDQ